MGPGHNVPCWQQVHGGLPPVQQKVDGRAGAETGPVPWVLKLVRAQADNLLQNALLLSSAGAFPLQRVFPLLKVCRRLAMLEVGGPERRSLVAGCVRPSVSRG